MKIGAGLPSAVGLTDGAMIAAWARTAETLGFDSIAAVDRLIAPTYDPLVALAAAAAVTTRVTLCTSVLLGPLRSTAVLAMQAASLDRLSNGRFQLGIAVGSRQPDYDAAGVSFQHRGRILDEQLAQLRLWWQEPQDFATPGPAPVQPGGPMILVGGTSDAAHRRVAAFGAGWICGVGGAEAAAAGQRAVTEHWHRAGRAGRPRLVSAMNYSLGADGAAVCERFVRRYYGTRPFVEDMIAETATTERGLREMIAAHRSIGCDELLLFPCSDDIGQLQAIADVLD